MSRSFVCGVCGRPIPAAALHVLIGSGVVCQACAGTREAHALTWCPISWHDGWDHGQPAADRATAVAVLAPTPTVTRDVTQDVTRNTGTGRAGTGISCSAASEVDLPESPGSAPGTPGGHPRTDTPGEAPGPQ